MKKLLSIILSVVIFGSTYSVLADTNNYIPLPPIEDGMNEGTEIGKALSLNYLLDDFDIYLPMSANIDNVIKNSGLSSTAFKLLDSENQVMPSDSKLSAGNVIQFPNNSFNENYFVKFLGDANNDGQYSVSDVVAIVDEVVNRRMVDKYDLNGDSNLTVTDIVSVRKQVLNMSYEINLTRLAAAKEKISNDAECYGITDEMFNDSQLYIGNRSRIANVMRKALRGENITIAAIGGSITEGDRCSDKATKSYPALVRDWWESMFPGQVQLVNAGISGTSSSFGNYRLQKDVLDYDPDFLIVEFAVNDNASNDALLNAQEAIVRRALESDCAVMQLFNTTVDYKGDGGQRYYKYVGNHYEVPQISTSNAFYNKEFNRADGKTFVFYDANNKDNSILADGVHPNDTGYAMYATLINKYLTDVYEIIGNIAYDDTIVPSETYDQHTPLYMDIVGVHPGKLEPYVEGGDNDKVTLVSLGDFQKLSEGINFRDKVGLQYGVTATYSENFDPMVIRIENCKLFQVFSKTATTGTDVLFEFYDANTMQPISLNFQIDTKYNGSIRTHRNAFESFEGKDLIVKIKPVINSARPGMTTCTLSQFIVS